MHITTLKLRLLLSAVILAGAAGCAQAPEAPKAEAAAAAAPVAPVASAAPAPSPAPSAAERAATQAAAAALPRPEPLIKGAHWHHFHINTTDPAKSIAYYLKHFDAKPAKFAGLQDAVWTQKSWLLFTKVNAKASTKLNTGIWHIGWGAPKPQEEYEKQKALGNTFFQPLTDISTGLQTFRPGQFYYMYVESPDRTLIELNTANHDNFGHMHMFAEDPIATGDFYIKFFGVRGRGLSSATVPSREPRISIPGLQVGPSTSVNFDDVNMIIYPANYSRKAYPEDWAGITELQSTRGNVNDHFGVSVPNLDEAMKVFRANNVKVTQEVREVKDASGKLLFKFAFIEGPDKVAIELIEDHSERPPEE